MEDKFLLEHQVVGGWECMQKILVSLLAADLVGALFHFLGEVCSRYLVGVLLALVQLHILKVVGAVQIDLVAGADILGLAGVLHLESAGALLLDSVEGMVLGPVDV